MHLIEYKTGRLRTLILFKYSKLSNMIFGHVNNFMHPFRTELSELCGQTAFKQRLVLLEWVRTSSLKRKHQGPELADICPLRNTAIGPRSKTRSAQRLLVIEPGMSRWIVCQASEFGVTKFSIKPGSLKAEGLQPDTNAMFFLRNFFSHAH